MRRKGDAVDGVMLLDKPEGLSSNRALQTVRRLLNARKAGHTGTLDPLATGLLPLCFGNATKFSADLLHADKSYVARVRLGVETTTGDAEGEVTKTTSCETLRFEDLLAVLDAFRGEIEQIPPMYSALKRDGECLYDLARRGETVEREARRVTIHSLEVSDWTQSAEGTFFTMATRVSKGTYIRVLAEDIGRALGVGAHLTALRRTGVGELTIAEAVSWNELEKATCDEARLKLAPVDRLLSTLPRVDLPEDEALRFRQGQRIAKAGLRAGLPAETPLVRVYCDVQLLGTGRLDPHGTLHPVRLLADG